MRRAAVLCAVLLAAACGDDAPVTSTEPVRGAPLRRPAQPREPEPPPAEAVRPEPAATRGGVPCFTFEQMSDFAYAPPKIQFDAAGDRLPVPAWEDTVPRRIYELAGTKLSVEGYVIPLDYEEGTFGRCIVAAFLPSCCFGDTIRPNQWVRVEMKDKRRVAYERGPHRATGVIRIVPHDSELALTELYQMTAESVEPVE